MKRLFIALTLLSVCLIGCSIADSQPSTRVEANTDVRKQMLDAQYDSIVLAKQQVTDFYNRNQGSINEWRPEIYNQYVALENQVSKLYEERQKLINKIGGLRDEDIPSVGSFSNQ